MSVLSPEGVPVSGPDAPRRSAPKAGLSASHVAGGGVIGAAGAVVVAVCNHFGWHVSDVDAVMVGGAAVSVGAGLGHVIGKVGVFGAFKQLLRGSNA